MTPLLLTLASLTPGDGGPGSGAAREAVAVKVGEGFKGFIRPGGWRPRSRVRRSRPWGSCRGPWRVSPARLATRPHSGWN